MGGLSISKPSLPSISLVPRVVLDPPQFQSKWMSLPASSSSNFNVNPASVSRIEASLVAVSILTLASGINNGVLKMYSYAQDSSTRSFFFTETIATVNNGAVKVTFKSENAGLTEAFQQFFTNALQSLK